MEEVIQDEVSGRLVGFFEKEKLVDAVAGLLCDKDARQSLGAAARATVLSRYDFASCTYPEYRDFLSRVASA